MFFILLHKEFFFSKFANEKPPGGVVSVFYFINTITITITVSITILIRVNIAKYKSHVIESNKGNG